MDLSQYTIQPTQTIFDALGKIEFNKKGFLIVTNENDIVLGTMTDGDIRRAFLKGLTVNNSIETIYSKNFNYINIEDSFERVIELFKPSKINFLPIIDARGKLTNVITKTQLHYALIEDIPFDLQFDFSFLDHFTLEHEIYNRPWGFYKTTFLNQYARAKIIKLYPGEELSLQEHKKREEHWVIVNGEGILIIGESEKKVVAGDYIYIPKGCKHKITNTSKTESLMISEVQLGEYFGEDDIIRYEDKYQRGKC